MVAVEVPGPSLWSPFKGSTHKHIHDLHATLRHETGNQSCVSMVFAPRSLSVKAAIPTWVPATLRNEGLPSSLQSKP